MKTVLVTGSSAGIGAALARVFAARKHDVILVARREDALEALAGQLEGLYGVRASVFPANLANPTAPPQLFETLRSAGIHVDVLVNNAGFGLSGEFAETDIERELEMIQVNVTALTYLTKLFMAPMLQRHSGAIMNVASTAALFPGPSAAIYHATKAYVLSFTEALAEELRDSGVTATALCPGPTVSEFYEVSGGRPVVVLGARVADARAVAEFAYDALQSGTRVAIPGVQNKLIVQARRVVPRNIVTRLVRRVRRAARP